MKIPEGFLSNQDAIKTNLMAVRTLIEVMKLYFEEEDLSERQECSALTSNLEGTALNCVMAKKQNQRDTADKIFEILLNRFGSGVQGHQAMMRFDRDPDFTRTIMAILTTDQQTKGITGTNQGTIWTRDALVQIAVRRTIMCQHSQPTNRA